ncbi:MAG: nucleoside kinase [Candidatus Cloacimonetes bacterium]|nr:nucleoside kinase [Candidatus Cloacimonadota bacterium]NLO10832.1 nucleoside kinase [Candidatus Cloacimonadota bacterium]
MIIDIRLNGVRHSNIEIEDPKPLADVIRETDIDPCLVLSYKINHTQYVNDEYLLQQNTMVNCITARHPEGYRIYQDSAIFILGKALYSLLGEKHSLVVEHSVGDGVFCEVFGTDIFTAEDCQRVKEEMREIVNSNLPINKEEVKLQEALDIFINLGRKDLHKNLSFTYRDSVQVYRCGHYYDFYIRPLADKTGMIQDFDVVYQEPGFILRFPSGKDFSIPKPFELPKKIFALHQEHDKWLNILKVHTIMDINRLVIDYDISQFILVEEALHEKKIAEIASDIASKKDVKLILIAGPSSSGKTTFAKRLSVQLQASRKRPIVLGMDDYFLDREHTARKDNGDFDFESIYAMDLDFLNQQLTDILAGNEVELPMYDFIRGVRRRSHNYVKLGEDDVLVMEGIHGLNDLLTASVPAKNKVKIYVSALNQLNIDNHNRIPTTDCRLLRRMVRDHQYRGYSARETLTRWVDVREGEEKNIFPFQENADYMFNSSLTYELGILRKHAWKLLQNVSKNSSAYMESMRLLGMLSHVRDIPDALVPHNSIIREFTNGSVFRY